MTKKDGNTERKEEGRETKELLVFTVHARYVEQTTEGAVNPDLAFNQPAT